MTVVDVEFRERSSPTLIRWAGTDCVASGSLSIERESGHVVQADMRCRDAAGRVAPQMTVRYAIDARLKLWVPAEMHEQPLEGVERVGVELVESKCVYTNYRRFETSARLILGQH